MNTEQLKYFIITAKHLNFSAAAKELYVTQPAISHQIAALEKELNTKLFTRTTRHIQLTRSGELFLEDAKRILDMEDLSRQRIQLANTAVDTTLRIAYLLEPCRSFLPRLLQQFHRQYPHVKLQLTRMVGKMLRESVETGQYDLYFSMEKDLNISPLSYRRLFTDRYHLICSPNHPCAGTNKIDFDKLATETFFMMTPDAGPFITREAQQILRENKITHSQIEYLPSMEEILFLVEAGVGISILPEKSQNFYQSSLVYIPLEGPHTTISFGTCWHPENNNPAIPWILELLNHEPSLE